MKNTALQKIDNLKKNKKITANFSISFWDVKLNEIENKMNISAKEAENIIKNNKEIKNNNDTYNFGFYISDNNKKILINWKKMYIIDFPIWG